MNKRSEAERESRWRIGRWFILLVGLAEQRGDGVFGVQRREIFRGDFWSFVASNCFVRQASDFVENSSVFYCVIKIGILIYEMITTFVKSLDFASSTGLCDKFVRLLLYH